MADKKKKLSAGVYRLPDGRIWIRVVATVRGKRLEATETLDAGMGHADGVARREQIVRAWQEDAAPARERAPTLVDYCERWIALRAKRVREVSIRSYAQILGAYLLPRLGHLRIDDIRRSDLEGWCAHLERTLKPRSARHVWHVGLMVIRDAAADYDLPDPSRRVDAPRGVAAPAGRALSQEELARLLKAGEEVLELRRYSALLTLASTGMRRTELIRQRWEDVDLEEGWLVVSHSKTAAGVGRKLPLPDAACDVLRRWSKQHPGGPWVWPRSDTARHVSTDHVGCLVARAAKAADLTVTPHDLRRTLATLLHRAQVDGVVRKALLGHTDVQVSDGYVRISDEDRRAGLRLIEGGAVGVESGTKKKKEEADAAVTGSVRITKG